MAGLGSGTGLVPEYKFCKFPPERLITGLLTIMVQNSDYRDDDDEQYHDDQMQRIQSQWDLAGVPVNAKKTFPLGRNIPDGSSILGIKPPITELAGDRYHVNYGYGGTNIHRDRSIMNNNGGDFDTFMYAVTANFHCEDKVIPNSNFTIPAESFNDGLAPFTPENGVGGYLTYNDLVTLGCDDRTSSTWALDFEHFGCQSFVRSTLLSRHNNAYQHDWHNSVFDTDNRYYNYRNSGIPDKEWHLNKDTSNDPNFDWFVSTDEDGNLSSTPTNPGRPKVDKRMFQNGVFSPKRWDPKGVVEPEEGWPTDDTPISWNLAEVAGSGNVGIDLSESAIDKDGTPRGNNTYFSPVYDIHIYGQHPLNVTNLISGTSTENTAENLKFNFSPVRVAYHPQDWWQLVVEINKWGYASGGTTEPGVDVVADRTFIKTRTNVFFQPFGETQQFEFKNEVHTE